MASDGRSGRRPGDNEDRELVYCHACEHEWHKDQDSDLTCPRCRSDVTEIVESSNDPRAFHHGDADPLFSQDPLAGHRRTDNDSDPDEADIEEHLYQGPMGRRMGRGRWAEPSVGGVPSGQNHQDGHHDPVNPQDSADVMHRFYDMLHSFGVPGPHARAGGRPGAAPNFGDDEQDLWGAPPPAPQQAQEAPHVGGLFGGGGPRNVRTFTSRSGNGSFTSFTITTGPIHMRAGARGVGAGTRGPNEQGGGQPDDFDAVFGNLMGGPPRAASEGEGGMGGQDNPTQNLVNSLGQLLALLSHPGNAQHGDAVYTQEALDRIVSQMMEQNPQSNAAPPASEDAISKLERRKVDDEMLGPEGSAECTICIDDLKKDEEVLYLPCKHWFHAECVVMWLKEHNTCPICRTPIEENRRANTNAGGAGDGQPGPSGTTADPLGGEGRTGGPHPPPPGAFPFRGFPGFDAGSSWASQPPPPPHPSTRPPASGVNVSFGQRGAPGRNSSNMGIRGYDVFPPRARRHSMSPPAQASNSRTRQRSPTPSSWERDRGQDGQQPGSQSQSPSHTQPQGQADAHAGGDNQGSGPLSWIRNQFSRGPGGGSEASRDRRRQ